LLAWPDKDIGTQLGLSPKTVRRHITKLGNKLLPNQRIVRIKLLLAALHGGYVKLTELSYGPRVFDVV